MTHFDQIYQHPLATKAHRDILTAQERPQYAGSFMKALCEALFRSDRENRERLRAGFPELVAAYEDWLASRGPFEIMDERATSSPN